MSLLSGLAVTCVCVSLLSSHAQAASPRPAATGAWQSENGEAQVKVTMCGNGRQLCAKLTALTGSARTTENLKLLNDYVIERAEPAASNIWQGTVHFNGQTAEGEITLVDADTITVHGCELGMCKTFAFRRMTGSQAMAQPASAQMPPRTVGLTLSE